MTNWLIRAAFCLPIIIGAALIIKIFLIEPYAVTMIEFDVIEAPMKKGDREI